MKKSVIETQGRHETIDAPNNSMQLAALRAAADAELLAEKQVKNKR
jgi:hypothetical protein